MSMRRQGCARAALSRALVLSLVVLLGVFPLVPTQPAWGALACAAVALTAASARLGVAPATHLGLLCSLLLVTLSAFGSMQFWPIPPVLATAAYLLLAKLSATKAHALGDFPRLARGRLDGGTWMLIGGSLVVSSAALIVWFAIAKPDYGEVLALLPRLPMPALLAGVLVFAIVNAALEETIYRGVVLGALDATLGAGVVPIVLQALIFGILHLHGFPRGLAGIGLATIYGLMMGTVRRRARGMLAPWIAHVGTDVAIGSILLASAP